MVPNPEDRVVGHEVGSPLVWLLDNIHVDAVFKVFLHVGIDKEVEACKVRKRDEFGKRCPLLVSQCLEELEMQVADFLLGD